MQSYNSLLILVEKGNYFHQPFYDHYRYYLLLFPATNSPFPINALSFTRDSSTFPALVFCFPFQFFSFSAYVKQMTRSVFVNLSLHHIVFDICGLTCVGDLRSRQWYIDIKLEFMMGILLSRSHCTSFFRRISHIKKCYLDDDFHQIFLFVMSENEN